MSYIRQDKCCETCEHLTEDGCANECEEQEQWDSDSKTYGTSCPVWQHWTLNEDEQEIVRLEAENGKLKTALREVLAHVENGTTWYPDEYKALLEEKWPDYCNECVGKKKESKVNEDGCKHYVGGPKLHKDGHITTVCNNQLWEG